MQRQILLSAVMLGCCLAAPSALAQSGDADAAGDQGLGGAIETKPILTPAQRRTIYQEASQDKSKVAPKQFAPVIGADVPPMIELFALPDDAFSQIPAAKLYKYTMVENKVVVVDPTRMRVIDVIGPELPQQR
ncbi:MAG TPA: DUF1236 domain-containing protein [Xanthobacteraceae bacterium]|nr:DUF1236 domain-containing protein [Xanthobacteraceae bacterium]